MMSKVTISITPELDAALDVAAMDRGLNKSRLVETFLREHATMVPIIREVRAEAPCSAYAASRKVSHGRSERVASRVSSGSE